MHESEKEQDKKTPTSLGDRRSTPGSAQPPPHAFPDVERAEEQQGVDEEEKLNTKQRSARAYVNPLRD